MSADNLDMSRVQRPVWDTEEVRGNPQPRLPAFLSSYQQDCPHATEGPAATSAFLQQTAVKSHLARHHASG